MPRVAITPTLRFAVLRRCNFACFYCGIPASLGLKQLHVDHVVPVSLGGTNAPWNLVAACWDCNAGKSNTVPPDTLIQAAVDLYWDDPGVRRAHGQCVSCGRIWVLTDNEIEAGEDPSTMQCWPCINAWVDGHYADRSWRGGGA